MICSFCNAYFKEDDQSPVCPHDAQIRNPPANGPVLRPWIKRGMDEAFQARNIDRLEEWTRSNNFAARYYAELLLQQIRESNEEPPLR